MRYAEARSGMPLRVCGVPPPRRGDLSALGDPFTLRVFPMTAVKEAN